MVSSTFTNSRLSDGDAKIDVDSKVSKVDTDGGDDKANWAKGHVKDGSIKGDEAVDEEGAGRA